MTDSRRVTWTSVANLAMFFFHWWVQPIVRQFPSSLQSTVAASPSTVNCETIPAANSQLPVVIGDIQVVPRKCLLIFRRSSKPWKMETKINTKSILFQMCGGGVGGSCNAAFADNLLERTFPDKNKWAKDKRKNWSQDGAPHLENCKSLPLPRSVSSIILHSW